ncbi:MAG: hypothetical protein IPM02_23510 [Betaproteobacteria bacterium]|nr:hypothetical protein [Betaproteobacteria bacterium]
MDLPSGWQLVHSGKARQPLETITPPMARRATTIAALVAQGSGPEQCRPADRAGVELGARDPAWHSDQARQDGAPASSQLKEDAFDCSSAALLSAGPCRRCWPLPVPPSRKPYPDKAGTADRQVAPAARRLRWAGRLLAQRLSESMGQPVNVESPGRRQPVAADLAAKAAPDGYAVHEHDDRLGHPAAVKDLPYDPLKASCRSRASRRHRTVLVINTSLPATNVAELVKLAKSSPASSTTPRRASPRFAHLAGEMLNLLADIKMTHPVQGRGRAA